MAGQVDDAALEIGDFAEPTGRNAGEPLADERALAASTRAHEALTALLPRLRQWLVDSRDFRHWQEQLRADLTRWQAQEHEAARLLSGIDLAEADRRLTEHPEAISADERGYIQLTRRHSRRGSRLRQAAVGALAVLTTLAVVLALSTWQSLKRTEQQLRTQAAGLLAQAAEDRPDSDPPPRCNSPWPRGTPSRTPRPARPCCTSTRAASTW